MRIGIVGGGLLGTCAALESALRGHDVHLFEREAACLTRASGRNEGKVHLGFVYGRDPTLATARVMARGAYTFAPLLCRWLGADALPGIGSSPVHYFVHRESLASSEELSVYYRRVVDLLREEAARPGARYLGGNLAPYCRRLSTSERRAIAGDRIVDAYETSELAIAPESLAAPLRRALAAQPRITLRCRTRIEAIAPGIDDVTVQGEGPDGRATETFDRVINASWDDLLRLDRTAGVEPPAGWSYRLKRYITVQGGHDATPPSATIVLGGFGDVVRYADGSLYLSWYPAGCTGLSAALRHPEADEVVSDEARRRLRLETWRELAQVVPGLSRVPADRVAEAEVDGGVILAHGVTDVGNTDSGLHVRTAIGPRRVGPYFSVNTGKWTTAPLFAMDVARQVDGDR